jgi:hypothetical protein
MHPSFSQQYQRLIRKAYHYATEADLDSLFSAINTYVKLKPGNDDLILKHLTQRIEWNEEEKGLLNNTPPPSVENTKQSNRTP